LPSTRDVAVAGLERGSRGAQGLTATSQLAAGPSVTSSSKSAVEASFISSLGSTGASLAFGAAGAGLAFALVDAEAAGAILVLEGQRKPETAE
jgi:hypothetical protein